MDEKSPEMRSFLNAVSEAMFGRSREKSIAINVCVVCGESAKDFKDALSEKEYAISGMCQKCQDSVFG
jgi:hypothetical protein